MNTRTQTLPLWAPSKDWASKSWSSRSHHRRIDVDGHVAYHLMRSAGKCWNKSRIKCRTQNLNPGWEPPTNDLCHYAVNPLVWCRNFYYGRTRAFFFVRSHFPYYFYFPYFILLFLGTEDPDSFFYVEFFSTTEGRRGAPGRGRS